MSTNVNPPLNLKIPRRLSGDVESDAFFRNLITILFQLWERTGGGDDTVSDLENEQPDTDALFSFFSVIEDIRFKNVAVVSTDYQSLGNEIVICDGALRVTLPQYPDDQTCIKVKRAAGQIVIDGNGKNIDGSGTITVIRKYTNLDLIYTVETDSWHIV